MLITQKLSWFGQQSIQCKICQIAIVKHSETKPYNELHIILKDSVCMNEPAVGMQMLHN